MIRRLAVAPLLVCFVAASLTSHSHSAFAADTEPPCGDLAATGCPITTNDGYVYAYDTLAKKFVRIPASVAGSPDPKAIYRYTLTPACPQAQPLADVNCTAAAQYCANNGQSGIHEDVWREQTAPAVVPWRIVNQVCVGPNEDSPTLGDVQLSASEYERTHVPIPVPNVQPATVALVNLPVIVSVPQPQPVTMQVQQPVPGTLVATPTFSWTFDDGATVTGAGVPYDGTDPRTDPTHYVSHTYAAADPHASVTLTVTWNATFTAAGQVFPIAPLVMPPISTAFAVQEAHAVLVSGE